MNEKKQIVILGCTGSIGMQTLDVIKKNSDKFCVVGLVAFSSKEKLLKSANDFKVKNILLVSEEKNQTEANKKISEMISNPKVDIVVNAMSGAVGLFASFATLKLNKILALANKESLVVGGDLIMPLAKEQSKIHNNKIRLLPIDSEHGAIFQCLVGEKNNEIFKLHITASGGPFFGYEKSQLQNITQKDALAHPTWNMGKKITIDSSTLMNKGLEVIEAHHLFDVDYEKINIVVQRQSIIHSMVEFNDGSIKAHLGTTDMRIPIMYALSFPERFQTPVKRLNFFELKNLDFYKPDYENFECLSLAFEAGKIGGTLPCVMNAANEIAVELFLKEKIKFLDIAKIIKQTMDASKKNDCLGLQKVESLEQLNFVDLWSRKTAKSFIKKLK